MRLRQNYIQIFLTSSFITWASFSWAQHSTGGDFSMNKDLVSSSGGGIGIQGGSGYALESSVGEPAAGFVMSSSSWTLAAGYLGGRLGAGQTLRIERINVGGSPKYFQNGLQIGVTVQAQVEIQFSDQLDGDVLPPGINIFIVADHMGQRQNVIAPVRWNYDNTRTKLILRSDSGWQGNTLYNAVIDKNVLSAEGYSLAVSTNVPFLTTLDPRQENVVFSPIDINALVSATPSSNDPSQMSLSLNIPRGALSDYAMVLFSQDPMAQPIHADPSIIKEANDKARASGGMYQTPLALAEVAAYNPDGQVLNTLSSPMQAVMSYSQLMAGASPLARSSTLALWALDTKHRLWVKMPASMMNSSVNAVSAPITRFSVYALMGSADGSTKDVFVFPTPWRPYGPHAGEGAGQTGTEAGGMTFNNLPSECKIKIYTLSRELVRELHHSDISGAVGQERWDGLTAHGSKAASGVYLWHVESSVDGKNGKLMVIR